MSALPVDNVFACCLADAGDANGKTCIGRGGVAAYDVDVPLLACCPKATIEVLEVFHREALAEGYAHDELARCAVHREDVADVHHCRLVAEVLHRDVGEVEVYALHEHVGGDEHLALGVVKHGAVVANAVAG